MNSEQVVLETKGVTVKLLAAVVLGPAKRWGRAKSTYQKHRKLV